MEPLVSVQFGLVLTFFEEGAEQHKEPRMLATAPFNLFLSKSHFICKLLTWYLIG